jgi:hypothetical protein
MYHRNQRHIEKFNLKEASGHIKRGRENLSLYSDKNYLPGDSVNENLTAEIDFISVNTRNEPHTSSRRIGKLGQPLIQIGSLSIPEWTELIPYSDSNWDRPLMVIHGDKWLNSLGLTPGRVRRLGADKIEYETLKDDEEINGYIYQWSSPYNSAYLRKLQCCRGISDEALNEGTCGEFWRPRAELTGICDSTIKAYCAGPAGDYDEACVCLNFTDEELAKMPVGYTPICHHVKCQTLGYKTSDMLRHKECPTSLTFCEQNMEMGEGAMNNMVKNVQFISSCGSEGGGGPVVNNSPDLLENPLFWIVSGGGLVILIILIIIIAIVSQQGGDSRDMSGIPPGTDERDVAWDPYNQRWVLMRE